MTMPPPPPITEPEDVVYTLVGTPGIPQVLYVPQNHCELWVAFVSASAYDIMCTYTKPLHDFLLTFSNLRKYASVLDNALKHCEMTRDPSLLYVILFNFIAYVPNVRKFYTQEDVPPDRRMHLLPRGCEAACVAGIRDVARQLAEKRITVQKFNALIFGILTTGCQNMGDRNWTYPPMPHRDWHSEMEKRNVNKAVDIDAMFLQALEGKQLAAAALKKS
jgi:hypothetical protein